ncbi:LPXTG cell wall anchor domain-containing protein [Bacillus licheniformis]
MTVEPKDPEPNTPGEPEKPEKPSQSDPADRGNELPNTATNTFNLILVGLGLLVVGSALWFFRRKRSV